MHRMARCFSAWIRWLVDEHGVHCHYVSTNYALHVLEYSRLSAVPTQHRVKLLKNINHNSTLTFASVVTILPGSLVSWSLLALMI